MNQDYLPSVLHAPPDSISMERALKQILNLLHELSTLPTSDEIKNTTEASIDDINTMLSKIRRD